MAEAATDPERFSNKRAEGYWLLREAFESQSIMIPDDDELVQELTSLKYKVVNSNGTIKMEEKEEAKKRLGKSPDLADSLMLTYLSEEESMTRTWLTAPEGACPICAPLNGYTIRFDAQYPNGLEPGSAHVACRCSESYKGDTA